MATWWMTLGTSLTRSALAPFPSHGPSYSQGFVMHFRISDTIILPS